MGRRKDCTLLHDSPQGSCEPTLAQRSPGKHLAPINEPRASFTAGAVRAGIGARVDGHNPPHNPASPTTTQHLCPPPCTEPWMQPARMGRTSPHPRAAGLHRGPVGRRQIVFSQETAWQGKQSVCKTYGSLEPRLAACHTSLFRKEEDLEKQKIIQSPACA